MTMKQTWNPNVDTSASSLGLIFYSKQFESIHVSKFILSTIVVLLSALAIASFSNDQAMAIDDEKASKTKQLNPVQKLADIPYDYEIAKSLAEAVTTGNQAEGSNKTPSFYGGSVTIDKAEQASKIPALAKINKEVDYAKQDLILFFCHNISSDVSVKTAKTDGNETSVIFTYNMGPTKDLKSHYQIFSIAKGVKWKVARKDLLGARLYHRSHFGQIASYDLATGSDTATKQD